MPRVGLLGGTFNPPHVGHLICAVEALGQLGLDEVRLVPVHTPPHKQAAGDPGAEIRAELCGLAVAGVPGLSVSRVELDRGGPSYTVDTLRELHATAPGDELTFIVGGDQAQALPGWREPADVLRLATLAVAEREGIGREDVRERLAGLGEGRGPVFFDMPRIDLSSSEIRRRVAAGRSIRWLVSDPVEQAICARGLYAAGRVPH